MRNHYYYYFISGLPDISLDDNKKILDLKDFREELKQNLCHEDYHFIELFFYKYDHINVLNILGKKTAPFSNLGNFSIDELEEEITRIREEGCNPKNRFPLYLQNFINASLYDLLDKTGISAENQLSLSYFQHAMKTGNLFIKEYFQFELNLLNFLTALMSRKYNLSYEHEVLGDDEMSQQIRSSHAKDFNLSGIFDYTNRLMQIIELTDILEREKKTDMLRWEYIETSSFFHYFTIERIFAYLVKLSIVIRWLNMPGEKGKKEFENTMTGLQSGYEIPNEYRSF